MLENNTKFQQKMSQKRNRRHKKWKLWTEKYNNQNKRLGRWRQQQTGGERGKNQQTWRQKIEITQYVERMHYIKIEQSFRSLWSNNRRSNICPRRVPGELKMGGADKVLEKQNPPNLAKEINLQRSLVVSNGITPVPPQKTTPRHIIVKLVKIKKNLKNREMTHSLC